MTLTNSESSLQDQLQNWQNFCQYHALGDWYGIWTRYSPNGEVIESFKCIRCFHLNEDKSVINHQNHYTYSDGKTESKTFGPYKKSIATPLFLNNSFSWGSMAVKSSSPFGFEIGFRHENRGASAAIMYDNNGILQRITISPEYLESFDKELNQPLVNKFYGNGQGVIESMTPNLKTSIPKPTAWKRLEDLSEYQQTLHFPESISISCPQQIQEGKEMLLTVDWLAKPTLLQRGIRHFDSSGFKIFTLETFTLNL